MPRSYHAHDPHMFEWFVKIVGVLLYIFCSVNENTFCIMYSAHVDANTICMIGSVELIRTYSVLYEYILYYMLCIADANTAVLHILLS